MLVSGYINSGKLTWMFFLEDGENQNYQACSVIYMKVSMLKVVLTQIIRTKNNQRQIISIVYSCIYLYYLHHHTSIEWFLSYSYIRKQLDQGWNLRGI